MYVESNFLYSLYNKFFFFFLIIMRIFEFFKILMSVEYAPRQIFYTGLLVILKPQTKYLKVVLRFYIKFCSRKIYKFLFQVF